jgi:hypothetical protein
MVENGLRLFDICFGSSSEDSCKWVKWHGEVRIVQEFARNIEIGKYEYRLEEFVMS